MYSIGTNLFAVPFDILQLKTTVIRFRLCKTSCDRRRSRMVPQILMFPKAERSYMRGQFSMQMGCVSCHRVDKTGRASAIAGLPPGFYATPRVSPDGKYVALETTDEGAFPSTNCPAKVNDDG